MKKAVLVLMMILCLLLSACGIKPPEKTSDGAAWDASWTTLGRAMGVEELEGWNLQRSEDVLAAEGMFYDVWTAGEAVTYTNEDGDEVTAYEAEIHLVVADSESAEKAQQLAADWEALTSERYPDCEVTQAEYAGQTFDICLTPQGASATGVRASCAIRVDVVVMESAAREPARILEDFLNHCHYAG